MKTAAAAAVLLLLLSNPARAQSAPCGADPAEVEVDKYTLLRRLSLDLRGRAPSIEEYKALEASPDVSEAVIREMVTSDDFRLAMRRYHEAMFWPNLSNLVLAGPGKLVGINGTEVAARITSSARAALYRGKNAAGCGDFEQTHFDPMYPGEFRPDPAFIQSAQVVVLGVTYTVKQEGWRWVAPYWAPQTPIKVCAFDAQQTPNGVVNTKPIACAPTTNDPACGCGPGLSTCYQFLRPNSSLPILESLREQLNRAVDEVATGASPYTALLHSTTLQQNGPIAFWKRNLAPLPPEEIFHLPDPGEEIADKPFDDAAWTSIDRKGLHSGVLTSPAFLLRFQTARARANRFRSNFLCEEFVPPADLTAQSGCAENTDDLTQRCYCQGCHKALEPMAAHWGLFAEAGTTHMSDRTQFPEVRTDCIGSNNPFCKRFYVFRKDAHNAGALAPYQWADLYPEVKQNLEVGPRALVERAIADGSLARCTVRKAFAHLVRRELASVGADTSEKALLDELAQGFAANGYSFPWLIEELVSLEQYRRIHR